MLTLGEATQNNCSGPAILNASYSVFNAPAFLEGSCYKVVVYASN